MSRDAVHAAIAGLAGLEAELGTPNRYLVACSGGLDSTVLLKAIVDARPRPATPVVAIHVNHGLQDDAGRFESASEAFATAAGVEFIALEVSVDTAAGTGIEAAAREARYAAIAAIMQPGDWLLSAHHADDQVETLLLNLLRGSGPDGLAAMPRYRRLDPGWLVRPLLGLTRAELEAAAIAGGLEWVDDPTNTATEFDRNFLRHEVLPALEQRWPDAVTRLLGSVDRARDAREILAAMGEADLALLGEPARLDITALAELPPARQRNAIRTALRRLGLPLPPRETLESILCDVLPARPDAMPLVEWPGGEARRYRDALYLMPPLPGAPSEPLPLSAEGAELPAGLGRLAFDSDQVDGLSADVMSRHLEVRWRSGGESLKLAPGGPTRKLKSLLQEAGVVPWMRDRLPLIYADDELVQVGDLYVAAGAKTRRGTAVRWLGHPRIH